MKNYFILDKRQDIEDKTEFVILDSLDNSAKRKSEAYKSI